MTLMSHSSGQMMFSFRDKMLVSGIPLAAIGLTSLPYSRTNPKQALRIFEVFAHMGLLGGFGVSLIVVGLLLVVASLFLKK
jgi:hypothetical protein